MSEIDKLKQFKPPVWSRLLGNYRAWRVACAARNKVYHVATLTVWVRYGEQPKSGYFQLFERGDGVRSLKYFRGRTHRDKEDFHLYHHCIIPWMHGKYSSKRIAEIAPLTTKVPTDWN